MCQNVCLCACAYCVVVSMKADDKREIIDAHVIEMREQQFRLQRQVEEAHSANLSIRSEILELQKENRSKQATLHHTQQTEAHVNVCM